MNIFSRKDNNKPKMQVSYPSAEMLLKMVLKEYDIEYQRAASLYNRTGIAISFLIALIFYGLIGMDIFRVKQLFAFDFINTLDKFYFFVVLSSYIILSASLIYSIINGFSVIFTTHGIKIDFDTYCKENMQYETDKMAAALVVSYTEVLKKLSENNDKKVGKYNLMVKGTIFSIFFSIIVIVLNQIIL